MATYKALTTINLPFTEVIKKPGDLVTEEELSAAQQSEESIKALVDSGALGGEDDELHPSTIVPQAGIPNIETVVAQAQDLVQRLESAGEEVDPKLRAVAELDTQHVVAGDTTPSSGEGVS